ncbi:MAG: M48 family metallopeptidase [Rhizobacter sp.]|nr:M48 family metallopeptidase [Rhizobacter sp.]
MRLRRGLRRIVGALQLGLFDELEGAEASAPSSSRSPPSASTPTRPVEPTGLAPTGAGPTTAEPMTVGPMSLGATSDAPAVAQAPWRHREASREAVLDGRTVAYRLVRVSRRSIGFVVDADGLTVRASRRVPLRDIDAAVQEKRRWIVARLVEQRERARRALAAQIAWRDGVAFAYLGGKAVVALDPAAPVAALLAAPSAGEPPRLVVALPRDASPERIREAVQGWLQREARRVFHERTEHFAARLGVGVRRLSLSSAATRWGSASADGSIRLHWRLIEHPLATIDYVVAHELAHLREMNHSPRFWAIVESVVPEYREVRRGLRFAERL